jgi:hypothetical protein
MKSQEMNFSALYEAVASISLLQIPMRSDNYVTEMMSFMQQFAVLAN